MLSLTDIHNVVLIMIWSDHVIPDNRRKQLYSGLTSSPFPGSVASLPKDRQELIWPLVVQEWQTWNDRQRLTESIEWCIISLRTDLICGSQVVQTAVNVADLACMDETVNDYQRRF